VVPWKQEFIMTKKTTDLAWRAESTGLSLGEIEEASFEIHQDRWSSNASARGALGTLPPLVETGCFRPTTEAGLFILRHPSRTVQEHVTNTTGADGMGTTKSWTRLA